MRTCGNGLGSAVMSAVLAVLVSGCATTGGGRPGVRSDGSYYTRIEWTSHAAEGQNCMYWVCNLIDDDLARDGGSWGAHAKGRPANVILSFFGDSREIGSFRIFHNVGASQSVIEELASRINVYVSSDEKARRLGDQDADINSIPWEKVKECRMEKKEYWAEFKLDKPVTARYVRLELVANFSDAATDPSKAEWTETNEIKFYPSAGVAQ